MDENNTHGTPVKNYRLHVGFNVNLTSPRPLASIDWFAIKANLIHTVNEMDKEALQASITHIVEY